MRGLLWRNRWRSRRGRGRLGGGRGRRRSGWRRPVEVVVSDGAFCWCGKSGRWMGLGRWGGRVTTPPPPSRLLFAALTMHVTASVVISARISDIFELRDAEGVGSEAASAAAGCRREDL